MIYRIDLTIVNTSSTSGLVFIAFPFYALFGMTIAYLIIHGILNLFFLKRKK